MRRQAVCNTMSTIKIWSRNLNLPGDLFYMCLYGSMYWEIISPMYEVVETRANPIMR